LEHKLREFENRVLKKILGPKRDDVTGGVGNYIKNIFMICTAHKILFG
jgi:isopentenyl phosphate kinase